MEEQTSPIQLPFHLSAPLPDPENKYTPAAEDKVVPMLIENTITEDERRPRAAAQRKQRGIPETKTGAATISKKALKAVRKNQSTLPHPYADELKRFEEQAKRINQILADRANSDRAHKGAMRESSSDSIAYPQPLPKASTQPTQWQIVQPSYQNPPIKDPPVKKLPVTNQWQSSTPIEEQTVEGLNLSAGSIHQRLHELGLYLHEADFRAPVSDTLSGSNLESPAQFQHSSLQNPETCQIPSFYPPTQATPSQAPQTESIPNQSRGTAANRLPRDRSHSRAGSPPMTLRRYLREWLRRLDDERSPELPRQPIERLSNAALWITTFAIVRVASRYVLAIFPILSPVFLGVILAPAIAAVYLLVCVPKTGWVVYYRLFLIMVGFLIGGKL